MMSEAEVVAIRLLVAIILLTSLSSLCIVGVLTRIAEALFRKKYNRRASAYRACVTVAIIILGAVVLAGVRHEMLLMFAVLWLLLWLVRDLHKAKKIEGLPSQNEHGIGWKMYFAFYILFGVGVLFVLVYESLGYGEADAITVFVELIHLILSSVFLYSWIWTKRISWLSKLRWLAKLWSVSCIFAPVALIVHGYFFFAGDIEQFSESFVWVFGIICLSPAMYVMYRLAWKSRLLYPPKEKEGGSVAEVRK